MSRDEALNLQAVQRWLASWLKPNKVPKGLDFTFGVPCFLLLDYADGRSLDSGRAYKTSEGELVFCLDSGGPAAPGKRVDAEALEGGADGRC